MSASAAIAPAPEGATRPVSLGRMILVTAVYLVIVIAAAIYPSISPLRESDPISLWWQLATVFSGLVWLVTLLVEMRRQPSGRLWKLIFLLVVADRILVLRLVPNSLVWSLATTVSLVSIPVFFHLLLAYPTGYLRDRFDRAVVLLAYVCVLGFSAVDHLIWEFAEGCDPDCIRNVFAVWPNAELHDAFGRVATLLFNGLFIPITIVALRRHWLAASPAARRTLLPVIVVAPVLLAIRGLQGVGFALDIQPINEAFDSRSGEIIGMIDFLLLPVALLIGILRARLGRVRIAGLMAELGRGVPLGGLRDVLAQTLGDPSLELAFAAPSGAGFVDANGQPIDVPTQDSTRTVTRLERDGELLGVLVHDPAIEDEDPGFVEAVGNAARLALENERLAAEVRAQLEEVRASRIRIVEAADSERQRVERNLHDGAQQRLVALAMRLQMAKETTSGAAGLLDEATTELQTAIGEVRGLARGIHPTILTEAGLRAAVDSLAERTPVPVTVDIPDRRYDPQLEATAYFVVAEALTNVARYARASEARVSAVGEDGRLVVTVVDDGRGGADPAAGSGLRGLADRLAALDGRLEISSPAGGGTTIRADLPLDRPIGTVTDEARLATAPTPLAMVRAVPQERASTRGRPRSRLSSPAVLFVVVLASIAVVALAAAVPEMGPRPPENGRADAFVRPFSYAVPAGSDIRLYSKSDHLQVLSPPPGELIGISIWAVEDVLQDHCKQGPDSAVVAREPGVEGLLSYLRSVARLHVEDLGHVVVDGRPASRVDLSMEGDSAGCDDPRSSIFLWRDAKGIPIQIPKQGHVPVTLLDVDDATIAIEIWSGGPIESWMPTAETIVASIRFFHSPAAASPSASTSAP
jgi:signal transduction histidine kinase